MTGTDLALLERWRRHRDAEAFTELVRRHSNMVYAASHRILCNAADARDVAQECFIQLLREQISIHTSLGAWLHKTAVNRSISLLRSESRRVQREKAFTESHEKTDANPDTAEVLASVDAAIAGLPDDLRIPLVERFLENRTHDAISQELGIAESTVRHRIQKAIDQIRKNLNRHGVVVSEAVLATILTGELSEAAPAALHATLAKLAMVGAQGVVKETAVATAGGLALLKPVATALITMLLIGFGWYIFTGFNAPVGPNSTSSVTMTTDTPQRPEELSDTGEASLEPVQANDGTRAGASVTATLASNNSGVISGHITDAKTGQPVAGVRVRVDPQDNPRGQVESEPTGLDGAYRVSNLPPGKYWVMPANVVGYPEYPFSGRINMTVKTNETLDNIDFALSKGARITGRVLDVNGVPVNDASVSAVTPDFSEQVSVASQADGTFALYLREPRNSVRVRARGDDAVSAALELSLPAEGVDDIELRLTILRSASVSGVVITAAGAPVSGKYIKISPSDFQELIVGGDAQLDAAGQFHIADLVAGDYHVFVRDGMDGPWSTDEAIMKITLSEGEQRTGLRIVCGDQGGLAISGYVMDTAGKPIADARVSCNGEQGQGAARTDDQGYFIISGLAEGTYGIHAMQEGYTQAGKGGIVAGTDDVTLVMKGQGGVEGFVHDAATDQAIPEFTVYFINGAHTQLNPSLLSNKRQVRNADGYFEITTIYAGSVTVAIEATGYAFALHQVLVIENDTVSVEFKLNPAMPVRGRVVARDGQGIADAIIFPATALLSVSEIERAALTRTDSDGAFYLDTIGDETPRLGAYAPGYASDEVAVSDGMIITLTRGGVIEGTVYFDGEQAASASIHVRQESPASVYLSTSSDEAGHFRLENVPLGLVTVRAAVNNMTRSASIQAIVEEDKTTTADLSITSGSAVLEGTVRCGTSAPAIGVLQIEVTTETDVESFNTRTDTMGAYRFAGLPAGQATLNVTVQPTEGTSALEVKSVQLTINEGQAHKQDVAF